MSLSKDLRGLCCFFYFFFLVQGIDDHDNSIYNNKITDKGMIAMANALLGNTTLTRIEFVLFFLFTLVGKLLIQG
jgi:hypothetical protein